MLHMPRFHCGAPTLLSSLNLLFWQQVAAFSQQTVRKDRKSGKGYSFFLHLYPPLRGYFTLERGSLPFELEPFFATATKADSPLQLKPVSMRHFLEQPSPSNRLPSSHSSDLQREHPHRQSSPLMRSKRLV